LENQKKGGTIFPRTSRAITNKRERPRMNLLYIALLPLSSSFLKKLKKFVYLKAP
jgi:hypothetical protein